MTILQAAVFGLIQGLTEFLPVSSSGHLAVLKSIWGYEQVSILFDILLHIATLLAVIVFFRQRVWKLIVSFVRWIGRRADEEDRVHLRLIVILIVATLVTAVLGIAIEKFLDPSEHIKLVSSLFLVTAAILLVTAFRKVGDRGYGDMNTKDALWLGFAQGLGVFPGISRSGITISAGIFAGLRREEAGEFSFLLSIPAIIGAAMLKIPDLGTLTGELGVGAISTGMLAAFLSGLLALLFLMSLVKNGKLHYFAFYLIPLGIAGLIFL